MSFKSFSTTHNAPAKAKPAANAGNGKAAPLVDHPPAPAAKAPAAAKPANKP